jgi:tetratricopeptide (TPR) repeat protein
VPVAFRGEVGVFLAERFVQLDKMELPLDSRSTAVAQKVATVLEEESTLHPLTIAYPIWAAQIHSVLGEKVDPKYLEAGQKDAELARTLSPNKQDILFILGRIYLLKKDFAKAIQIQQAAVAVEPSIPVGHWFLGLSYQAAGQSKEALAEIHRAVELGYGPSDDQEFYIIDLELAAKNYDAVIKGYTKFLEREPENPNWYIRLATVYAVKGDKKSAFEFAEKAVALDPSIRAAADAFIKEYKLR